MWQQVLLPAQDTCLCTVRGPSCMRSGPVHRTQAGSSAVPPCRHKVSQAKRPCELRRVSLPSQAAVQGLQHGGQATHAGWCMRVGVLYAMYTRYNRQLMVSGGGARVAEGGPLLAAVCAPRQLLRLLLRHAQVPPACLMQPCLMLVSTDMYVRILWPAASTGSWHQACELKRHYRKCQHAWNAAQLSVHAVAVPRAALHPGHHHACWYDGFSGAEHHMQGVEDCSQGPRQDLLPPPAGPAGAEVQPAHHAQRRQGVPGPEIGAAPRLLQCQEGTIGRSPTVRTVWYCMVWQLHLALSGVCPTCHSLHWDVWILFEGYTARVCPVAPPGLAVLAPCLL